MADQDVGDAGGVVHAKALPVPFHPLAELPVVVLRHCSIPAPAALPRMVSGSIRSEEHTSELQSPCNLVCRLLLEKTTLLRQPEDQREFRSQEVLAREHPNLLAEAFAPAVYFLKIRQLPRYTLFPYSAPFRS